MICGCGLLLVIGTLALVFIIVVIMMFGLFNSVGIIIVNIFALRLDCFVFSCLVVLGLVLILLLVLLCALQVLFVLVVVGFAVVLLFD